jgi:cytochrome c
MKRIITKEVKTMKKSLIVFLTVILGMAFGGSVLARGTTEEAKALVEKAASYYKANGKENTLKETSNPKGQFIKGDLYVYVYALSDCTILAHPINPKLIGKNMVSIPDPDGKLFRKDIWEMAKSKGSGWVDYKYLNPESKKIEHKTTYLQKIEDLILCCGAYK